MPRLFLGTSALPATHYPRRPQLTGQVKLPTRLLRARTPRTGVRMAQRTLRSDAVDVDDLAETRARRASALGESLVGSEILKIAAEIRALRAGGTQICNLTVGDFDPAEFRIPRTLEQKIADGLSRGETNYPPSEGVQPLRQAVSEFYERWLGLKYAPTRVLITGGSRPGIYGTFRTIVDPGDRVVYPVPSWNNNHYVHLTGAVGVPVPCGPEESFLPTPAPLSGRASALRDVRSGVLDVDVRRHAARRPGEPASGDGAVHGDRRRRVEGVCRDGHPRRLGGGTARHRSAHVEPPRPHRRVGAARRAGRDGAVPGAGRRHQEVPRRVHASARA